MQCRDSVKVLFSALVVEQGAVLHGLFDHWNGDVKMERRRHSSILYGCSAYTLGGQFKYIKCYASVTVGKDGDLLQCILINGDVQLTEAAFFVGESTPENG